MDASRVLLVVMWASAIVIACLVIIPLGRRKASTVVSIGVCALLLAGLMLFLDRWTPRPKSELAATKDVPCIADDPQYVPPKGKGIRMEFDIRDHQLAEVMCPTRSMNELARIDCLCPNRLQYNLKALPPPTASNFETEITVKKVCHPIYKARVFLRDIYTQTGYITMSPYNPPESHVTGGFEEVDFDKTSFLIKSSAPEDELRFSVLTAMGLRILCVNQIN